MSTLRDKLEPRGGVGWKQLRAGVLGVAIMALAAGIAAGDGRDAGVVTLTRAIAAAADDPATGMADDCRWCHFCEQPTKEDPCLLTCRRPQPKVDEQGIILAQGLETVILDELEDAYAPVSFNHKGHADMADMSGGCALCHHYTPAGMNYPACKTCHPLSNEQADVNKPALLGAYHQRCLNCHREWINEKQCAVCHEKKAGAAVDRVDPTITELMGMKHEPIPEPEGELYGPAQPVAGSPRVIFRHREHTERFGLRCVECHHESGCKRCHGDHETVRESRTLTEHHQPCVRCHKSGMDLSAWRAEKCDRCHWREGQPKPETFDHAGVGWPLKAYHRDRSCRACHQQAPFTKLNTACDSCHPAWDANSFDHAVTGQLLDETHESIDCAECHANGKYDTPPTCTECHDAEDGSIAFPSRRPGKWMEQERQSQE